MAGIDVANFLGITPMVGKEELPNEAARLAENCRLEGGDLQSWMIPLTVKVLTSLTPILSIYRYGIASHIETDFWFQFTTDVDVVKGPLDADIEERTYWTGDGAYPKKTKSDIATTAPPYPSNSFRMGIPVPVLAPSLTITGTATDPTNDPTTTALWGYTYVTTWDEEGPMSPNSNIVSWQPGQTPHLAGMSGAPAGAYTINRKRIYRAVVGTDATDFQFVVEIPVATATYDDTVAVPGKIAESRLWIPPPDDLKGLCLMSNSFMAGFSGNQVCFSVPDVPYAWPQRYRVNMPSPVIGIKAFSTALLVCHERGTTILSGTDPAVIAEQEVTGVGVCVSKRGMVAMLDGVLYPSARGLEYVGTNGAQLLTAVKFDEDSWAVYKPSSFTAAQVNSRYVACYDTGAVQGSIIFSFIIPDAVTTHTEWGTALWQDKATDKLYIVQSNIIKRWNGGVTALTAKWLSKDFRFSRSVNMACARVEADTYPCTLKVLADGTIIHTQTVTDGYAFPLPGDYEYLRYAFQYEGISRLTRVSLATTMGEMRAMQ